MAQEEIEFVISGKFAAKIWDTLTRCRQLIDDAGIHSENLPEHDWQARLPYVTVLGLLAFQENGPQTYQTSRLDYMQSVSQQFPQAYQLWRSSDSTKSLKLSVLHPSTNQIQSLELGSIRGYSGVLPLTRQGHANYLLGIKSQFELADESGSFICQDNILEGMSAIYAQALFDLRYLPFRKHPSSLLLRGFEREIDLNFDLTRDPDVTVFCNHREVTKKEQVIGIFESKLSVSAPEKQRLRFLRSGLHGLFSKNWDPTQVQGRPPVILFEATSRDGERFARQTYCFWRPMAISKDGNRIFGFDFRELRWPDRMNREHVADIERFLRDLGAA